MIELPSVAKAVAVGAGVGTTLAVALAAMPEIPLSVPEPHTGLDLTIIAMLIKSWSDSKQKEKQKESPEERGNWRELLMQKLEDLAYGTRETRQDLRAHRDDLMEFRSETREQFTHLSARVETIEEKIK